MGLGFRVGSFGFSVLGLVGFRVESFGFGVLGLGIRVAVLVLGLGFGVLGLRILLLLKDTSGSLLVSGALNWRWGTSPETSES